MLSRSSSDMIQHIHHNLNYEIPLKVIWILFEYSESVNQGHFDHNFHYLMQSYLVVYQFFYQSSFMFIRKMPKYYGQSNDLLVIRCGHSEWIFMKRAREWVHK